MALVVIFFSQPKTSCPEEVFQDAFPRGKKISFVSSTFQPANFIHSIPGHLVLSALILNTPSANFTNLFRPIIIHSTRTSRRTLEEVKKVFPHIHVCTTHIHCKRRTFFLPRTIHVPSPRQLAFQTLTRPSTIYYYHHQASACQFFSPCLVEHTTSRLPTPSPTLPSPNKTKASVIRMA